MLSTLVWAVLSFQVCVATFFSDADMLLWLKNHHCRTSCPPVDCRLLEAVVLGYCCGCAMPYDHIPMVCPRDVPCPEVFDPLCYEYNYLMEYCCRWAN